jgi:hypothetical protein
MDRKQRGSSSRARKDKKENGKLDSSENCQSHLQVQRSDFLLGFPVSKSSRSHTCPKVVALFLPISMTWANLPLMGDTMGLSVSKRNNLQSNLSKNGHPVYRTLFLAGFISLSLSCGRAPEFEQLKEPDPILRTCEGFEALEISDIQINPNETHALIALQGSLGEAIGPMSWVITPGYDTALSGLSVQAQLEPGFYTATAYSGDGFCNDQIQFRISKLTCSPSVTQIQVSYTPTSPIYTDTTVSFSIQNASDFDKLYWNFDNGQTGGWDITQGQSRQNPPTQVFTVARSYNISFSAEGPETCGQISDRIQLSSQNHATSMDFIVGVNSTRPPIKFFFIVDNSETMENNQVNLRTSFEQMFSQQNRQLLKPFDVNAYLFTTAQYSVDPRNDPDNLSTIPPRNRIGYFASFSYDFIYGSYGPRSLGYHGDFGRVPGDVIGYWDSESGSNATYEIQAVARFIPNPGGSDLSPSSYTFPEHLNANSTNAQIDDFVAYFQERVDLLDPDNYKSSKYDPMTQRENGLCAVARILRNYQDYLDPGDQPAFVLVSDEDDHYADGENCYQSVGIRTLYYGTCNVDGTEFRYSKPPYCSVRYAKGTNYSYQLERTRITYYSCVATDTDPCGNHKVQTTYKYGSPPSAGACAGWSGVSTAPGTSITCSEANEHKTGTHHNEFYSPGSACSFTPSSSYYIPGTCVYGGYDYSDSTRSIPPSGDCNDHCAGKISCTAREHSDGGKYEIPINNLTCQSQCPAGYCGGQTHLTIKQYLSSYGEGCTAYPDRSIPNSGTILRDPNDPNACPPGEDFKVINGYPTHTETIEDLVSSPTPGAAPVDLISYIEQRSTDLQMLGVHKPTFTSFVHTSVPSSPGESLGQKYIDLAHTMGANNIVEDISQSYGPALTQVSQFIRETLDKKFLINIPAGQQVREVWLNNTVRLQSGWSLSQGYIIFDATVYDTSASPIELQGNDRLTVKIW